MPSFTFFPQMEEVLSGRLRLRYSATNDTYYRDRQDLLNPDSVNSSSGWDSLTYECENIDRQSDPNNNEIFLGRTAGTYHGRLTWKFDFTCCGLVVDYIMLKVESEEDGGGQVSINLLGNAGSKYVSCIEGEGCATLKGLEGSTTIMLSADLLGDSSTQVSRLFRQSIFDHFGQCPFDVTIRLKRPDYTIGRSLILIGLMFSTKQETSLTRSRIAKSTRPTGAGFLHVHVNQAKRLPHRTSGSLPDPQVKCILQEGDRRITCKTRKLRKTTNPIWDESLSLEGICREDLKGQLFDILIYHFNLGITKKKELLGRVTIGWGSDRYLGNLPRIMSEDQDENDNMIVDSDSGLDYENYNDGSCQDSQTFVGLENYRNQSESCSTLIDIVRNDVSISMPSLGDMSSNSVHDFSELAQSAEISVEDIDKTPPPKRRSLAKIFGFGTPKHKQLYGIHPTIIVSNSTESVVILKSRGLSDCQGRERSSSKPSGLTRKARSLSNLLSSTNEENDFYKRRETLSPCPTSEGTWLSLLEGDYLTKSAVSLAARQWRRVYNSPEQWVYCWHPVF